MRRKGGNVTGLRSEGLSAFETLLRRRVAAYWEVNRILARTPFGASVLLDREFS